MQSSTAKAQMTAPEWRLGASILLATSAVRGFELTARPPAEAPLLGSCPAFARPPSSPPFPPSREKRSDSHSRSALVNVFVVPCAAARHSLDQPRLGGNLWGAGPHSVPLRGR